MEKFLKKELVGIGLRHTHFSEIIRRINAKDNLQIGWFEGISENFIDTQGRPMEILKSIRERYPISLHGVSLSLAGPEPIDRIYLSKLKALYDEIDPILISDHLCWTGVESNKLHNLLPFPYTQEFLKILIPRVNEVQDYLERQINLENLSAYFTLKESEMNEWQFLNELQSSTNCGLLLDINNVFVNSVNQKFAAIDFIDNINFNAVNEVHLAGHSDMGTYLFDTHSKEVCDDVWKLFRRFLHRKSDVKTLIEWDEEIPSLDRVIKEAHKALEVLSNV